MNDWQEIIGGTWYSSSPFLLHRNHHFRHHHSRRFGGSSNSLLEVNDNSSSGSGQATAAAAGSNGGANNNTNARRVRCCIFSKRWLFFFLFHLGCLAVDHSTRELSYEEEEVRLLADSSSSSSSAKAMKFLGGDPRQPLLTSENSILSFHPSSLDFKDSPVGIPQLGLVRVENRLNDENVKLISISGSTIHFHSSFFADKNISPGGNTTFEIVFLSRVEGQIESNLYIHTSKGLFKFQVQGFGLPNPYRLKPLIGARIPINGSYEPIITIHNPHGDPIQVVEMLSSDTEFNLSFPDDVTEEGVGLAWAVEPFQTKSLMKGSFQGKVEGNHTGYIKIRVNSSSIPTPEYLLVPVEVQVTEKPGIYSSQDWLDFGLMVKSDKPKTLSLSLINARGVAVNIQSVVVRGNRNAAVKIEFRPLSLDADISLSTVIALVTFDPSKVRSLKESHGYIEISSDSGDSLSVPFRTNFLYGQLEYNSSALGFFVKANQIPPRNFSVRNTFPSAAVIYDVSVSHPEIVNIEKLNQSHVISPGECKDIFTVRVHKKVELCESRTPVELTVKSNITNLKLPLTCYDGKLNLHTMDEENVDFGRIELLSTHVEYFSVDNLNPVEIRLKSWVTNCSSCSLELVGMQRGTKEDLSRIQDYDSLKKSLFLQPRHMAIFSVEVRRPSAEGEFWSEAVITTDHNQTIRVPFYFSVWKGAIRSDVLTFDKAFPGKISSEKLHLTSTINVTTNVLGISASPNSPVWFTANSQDEYPEILPNGRNYVGKVHFDANKLCSSECYSGFNADSSIGRSWVSGMNVSWDTGETDWQILRRLQKRYDQVKNASFSNISLWVETTSATQGSGYKVKTRVSYTWPRLTSNKSTTFPLTALGNESVMDIPVTNPSTSPLLVQAILASDYGPLWSQFVQGQSVVGNLTEGNSVFCIDGVGSSSHANESSAIFTQRQRQTVSNLLDIVAFYLPGVVFLLPAGAKFNLRIKFKPNSKEMASTMLLLRNNLTGIETTWLKGRAGTGQLTLGNGLSGSSLQFQITERLLQGCNQRISDGKPAQPPQLTVRRSFVARNIGEIPLHIKHMDIFPAQESYWMYWFYNVMPPAEEDFCEGFGYRILNCQPFSLLPNQTHSLDIAFSPDFTMSKIVQTLRLTDVNGMYFNYTLAGMVPNSMLPICTEALPRPPWESLLKCIVIAAIAMATIAAAIMGYVEASAIVSSTVLATVRVVPEDDVFTHNFLNFTIKIVACVSLSLVLYKLLKQFVSLCRNIKVRYFDLRDTCKLDLKEVYEKVENRFKRNQIQQQASQAAKGNSPQASTSPPVPAQTDNAKPGSPIEISAQSNAVAIASGTPGGTVPNHLNNSGNNNVRNRKKNKMNNNIPTELNLNHSSSSSPTEKPNPTKAAAEPKPVSASSNSPQAEVAPNTSPKSKQDKQEQATSKTASPLGLTAETSSPSTSQVSARPGTPTVETPPDKQTPNNNHNNRQSRGNSKRRRKQRNQQRRNNSKASASPVPNDSSSPPPSPSPKAEEETSSTTTESSNSEELSSLLAEPNEKERKLSGKSNESESEQGSMTGGCETWNMKGKGKSWKNNAKASSSQANFNKNANVVVGLPKAIDDLGHKDGGWQKKKELSGSSSSGSRGSLSPKQELSSAWDTPRPSSGLSERSSHTEQRSGKRVIMVAPTPLSGIRQFGANTGGHKSPPTVSYREQMSKQYQQQQQPSYLTKAKQLTGQTGAFEANSRAVISKPPPAQQSKAVGVIGERPANLRNPSGDGNASMGFPAFAPPLNEAGYLPDSFLAAQAPTLTLGDLANNMNAIDQYKASTSYLNSTWGNEIFDNGYDFWKRKLCSDISNVPTTQGNSHNVSMAAGANDGFQLTRQNYFRPSTNAPAPTSTGNLYSSQTPSSVASAQRASPTGNTFHSSTSGFSQHQRPTETVQLNEMLANLWKPQQQQQAYSTNFENDGSAAAQQSIPRCSPVQFAYYNQTTGQYQPAQHNHLHRQRSEPSNRLHSMAHGSGNSAYGHGYSGGFADNQHSQGNANHLHQQTLEQMSAVAEDSGFGWPPTSVAVTESGTWTRSASGERSSANEPTWPTLGSEHKWSRTEEKSPPLSVESLAVGSGNRARINNTPPFSHSSASASSGLGFADTHIRAPQDVAKSQREVEAGLGFNPFKTDIWNQGDTPGWTNAFSNFGNSGKPE